MQPFSKKGHVVERLLALCERLRGEDGCAWDREQSLASLTPYLLEEVHEVIEAISGSDRRAVAEELGDLLFVTIFALHAAETEGVSRLEAIVDATHAKLVRRHPHVFDETGDHDPDHARRQWQRAKREESPSEDRSVLGDRPGKRPALLTAFRLQEKAAAVGFDWEDHRGALAKVREETDEVEAATGATPAAASVHGGRAEIVSELGDLLFAAVNLCRKLDSDPEQVLRAANRRFYGRFRTVEASLGATGRRPEEASLDELEALWQESKSGDHGRGD